MRELLRPYLDHLVTVYVKAQAGIADRLAKATGYLDAIGDDGALLLRAEGKDGVVLHVVVPAQSIESIVINDGTLRKR